jgi:hypothetical protein
LLFIPAADRHRPCFWFFDGTYRGKTTLEITYRDTIPVDSIVVFKDEFKK